jgi:hypothetical protein
MAGTSYVPGLNNKPGHDEREVCQGAKGKWSGVSSGHDERELSYQSKRPGMSPAFARNERVPNYLPFLRSRTTTSMRAIS